MQKKNRLGTMGMGIAENLLKRGYVVQGFDLLPERMQLLEQKGGTAAPSPAQAADGDIFRLFKTK